MDHRKSIIEIDHINWANLTEAKSSSFKKDFIKFYEIALKSTNETKYWLCLLRDSGLVKNEQIGLVIKETNEIGNMIVSSLLTMKNKKKKRFMDFRYGFDI